MLFNTANSKFSLFNLIGLLVFVSLLMTGCGGAGSGGGSKGGPASSYTIGGTISGLAGPVVLQDMGGDNLTIQADGKFTFAIPINNGNLYNVTVLTQPSGKTCSISSGSGIVSGNTVANVAIFCSSLKYNVGGTISGLTGSVTLQNNTGDDYTLSTNGSYTFPTQVAFGSPYSVTVLTQPPGNQTCSVANATATGTMGAANVSNVTITCATSTYPVGVAVTGFNTSTPSSSLILQNNGADNLTITTNSSFNFLTGVAYGNPYNVTVYQQPIHQACIVAAASASGIVAGIVSNIAIACGNLNGGGVQGQSLNLTPTVSTFVGEPQTADGTGGAARFNNPTDAITDGTYLYVADANNNLIRKVVIATGVVTTLAGSGQTGAADGIGAAASFAFSTNNSSFGYSSFNGVGITTDGQFLYVVDTGNNKIRRVDPTTGEVVSLTGTTGISTTPVPAVTAGAVDSVLTAPVYTNVVTSLGTTYFYQAQNVSFNSPTGITYVGGYLYVTDKLNNKIRRISTSSGKVVSLTGQSSTAVTIAGGYPYILNATEDGAPASTTELGATFLQARAATFYYPSGITNDGANLYVVDGYNYKIRKINISTSVVGSVTGTPGAPSSSGSADGPVGTATFYNYGTGVTTDGTGTNLYLADTYNNKIRKINLTTNQVSSFTGMLNISQTYGTVDGIGPVSRFNYPQGITSDGINLYVADSGNNTIRTIPISSGNVSTLAGAYLGVDGSGPSASMNSPWGVTTDGINLYVADSQSNKIRKVVIATGAVTTLAGTGLTSCTPTSACALDGNGTIATFNFPTGITTDGVNLYVNDNRNNKIRKIAPATGYSLATATSANVTVSSYTGGSNLVVTSGATDGAGASASFNAPYGITTDGSNLYVSDTFNNKIRKISPDTGYTLATATSSHVTVSSFTGPTNNTAGLTGSSDYPTAATGAAATFNWPLGITTDGTSLYVADYGNNKIRMINISSQKVFSLTGGIGNVVTAAAVDDPTATWAVQLTYGSISFYQNPTASFSMPFDVTTDGSNLYVADYGNYKIRKISLSTGAVSSLTGAADTASAIGATDGAGAVALFRSPFSLTTDGSSLFVPDAYTIRRIK
jgi:sugar lactone lactonase YvrE